MLTMDSLRAFIETSAGCEVLHTALVLTPEKRTIRQKSQLRDGREFASATEVDTSVLGIIFAIFPNVKEPGAAHVVAADIDWVRSTVSTVFYFGLPGHKDARKVIEHKQF